MKVAPAGDPSYPSRAYGGAQDEVSDTVREPAKAPDALVGLVTPPEVIVAAAFAGAAVVKTTLTRYGWLAFSGAGAAGSPEAQVIFAALVSEHETGTWVSAPVVAFCEYSLTALVLSARSGVPDGSCPPVLQPVAPQMDVSSSAAGKVMVNAPAFLSATATVGTNRLVVNPRKSAQLLVLQPSWVSLTLFGSVMV